MEKKICNKCLIEKEVIQFHKWKYSLDGYKRICKECRKKETKFYYEKYNKKIKIKNCIYRKKNIEKVKTYRKNNYSKNKEKILHQNKIYRENNKTKRNEYQKKRKLNDPLFKLKHLINSRVRVFMKSRNVTKKNKTFEIIGCSPEFLKKYLETKFTDGMCWEKFGKEIHIDHIIPLSSAKNEKDIYKLCHYTNLQPLWAIENMKKGAKLITP